MLEQKFLMNGPDAVHLLNLASTKTGTKALLGDFEHLDPVVRADVQMAHVELNHAVNQLTALLQDPTRPSLPEKHAAGKVLSEKTATKLQKVHDQLLRNADHLEKEAMRVADAEFGPRSDTAGLDSEIRAYFREQTKTKDGLDRIKRAITTSDDAARALWSSPSFLTGIPEDSHAELRLEALEARRPHLYAKLSSALDMTNTAEKFSSVIKRVPSAFYSPTLAEQVKQRVQV